METTYELEIFIPAIQLWQTWNFYTTKDLALANAKHFESINVDTHINTIYGGEW